MNPVFPSVSRMAGAGSVQLQRLATRLKLSTSSFSVPMPFLTVLLTLMATAAFAAPPNRIAVRVDNSRRVFLKGHVHPKTSLGTDQGRLGSATEITHLSINFKLSAAQTSDLNQLLADQQNPASPRYHRWLTPEEYGTRFGVSDADLAQVTSWLQGQGFNVTGSAKARNFVTFDGAAAAVETAFGTELHQYLVDGESHYANATEPSIPAALEPLVGSIHGLNNFRLKAHLRNHGLKPRETTASGHHYVAPDDFASIYNLKPLYAAGYDGTGQKLVIIGQTALRQSDLQTFRTMYNLPAQDLQPVLVPNSRDPGVRTGDVDEATLDVEWSGAVARNASILYVYASNVNTAVQYAIDQNLAPVISMSYGGCEPLDIASDARQYQALAQQANAQGITWFNASGDSGGADCSSQSSSNGTLSVDLPASVPEITAVGGTEFNEGPGTYWNDTNDGNSASAQGYIPEMAWNDSVAEGSPSSGGGGASIYFPKPSWQTGAGVPSDNARFVPDIAMSASASHDGYDTYVGGKLYSYGGTSAPTPMMAGVAAILNQYLIHNGGMSAAGLGNINPKLYALAQTAPQVFHDVTTGDNIVTITCTRRCTSQPGPVGYTTGVGYDPVTGLGSLDLANFFEAWAGGPSSRTLPTINVSSNSTMLSTGDSAVLTVTVAGPNGTTPTGSVTFLLGTNTLGSATLSGSGGTASTSITIAASQLGSGTNNIVVQYNSDNSTFSSASGTVTVTVGNPIGLTISGVADGASFRHSYAPGEVLSIFGSGLAVSAQLAASVPLPSTLGGVAVTIHGVTAPIYSISPGQLNVQIPYETPVGPGAALIVSSNGQTASYSIDIAATAPAIFADSTGAPMPTSSARAGDAASLFITGAGALSPSVATGAAPADGTAVASLPKPATQPVTVIVGGVTASITFAGVPPGLVGALQINYIVPPGLAPGIHPVVVTIGNASSAEGNLTVTP